MKKIFVTGFLLITIALSYAQPFQVGHTTINFTDPARNNRVIQTEIYYPANAAGTDVAIANGKFPVLVFGHGFVMIWSAYQNLWDNFVPRGYIMAFPRTEGNISPSHGEFGKDLKFLVAAMQNEGSLSTSIFFNGVKNKTAIMGHSMGGGSSILGAANNSTIETVVSFAPAETNPSAKAAGDSVTVDALILAGTQDGVAPLATNAVPIYDTLNSSCKTYIGIVGGAHCYFANTNFNCDFGESSSSTGITITRTQQQSVTNDFVSLWLDYKLKGDCGAFAAFNDSLSQSPRITHMQICPSNPVPVITNNSGTLESTSALTYQWYFEGVLISGAINQQHVPSQDGDYFVMTGYQNGCPEKSADYLFCSGIKPVITETIGTLNAGLGISYQWYFEGNALPGETQQSYMPVLAGNYTVEVYLASGCSGTSLPFMISPAGNENIFSLSGYSVFPNPAKNLLNIVSLNQNRKWGKIHFFNSYGQEFKFFEQANSPEKDKLSFNISNLLPGLYFILIKNESTSCLWKFSKQ